MPKAAVTDGRLAAGKRAPSHPLVHVPAAAVTDGVTLLARGYTVHVPAAAVTNASRCAPGRRAGRGARPAISKQEAAPLAAIRREARPAVHMPPKQQR